jgi:hypothetical protein
MKTLRLEVWILLEFIFFFIGTNGQCLQQIGVSPVTLAITNTGSFDPTCFSLGNIGTSTRYPFYMKYYLWISRRLEISNSRSKDRRGY